MLRVKLRRLGEERRRAQHRCASAYDNAFAGIAGSPRRSAAEQHARLPTSTLKWPTGSAKPFASIWRQRVFLAMILLPRALPLQNAYKTARFAEGSLPVTESITTDVLLAHEHSVLRAATGAHHIGLKAFFPNNK